MPIRYSSNRRGHNKKKEYIHVITNRKKDVYNHFIGRKLYIITNRKKDVYNH